MHRCGAQALENFTRATAEDQPGGSAGLARHRDLFPGHASPTSSERLHARFFGGEPGGVTAPGRSLAAAISYFLLRINSFQETLAVSFNDCSDAIDFCEVHTDGKNHSAIIDDMFLEHQCEGVLYLTLEPLRRLHFLRHAFGTRQGEKRRRYFSVLGHPDWPLQRVRQTHSNTVQRIDRFSPDPPSGDGLITNRAGIWLGIETADCLPILVVDPVRRVVGNFHAGWRGTAAGIIKVGIERLRSDFGSDPARLHCGIGPGIAACCYEVGAEVYEAFADQRDRDLFFGPGAGPGKFQLDLWKANHLQLLSAGVPTEQVYGQPYCTACNPQLFFSHRGEHGRTGRMLAVVGVASDE